MNQVFTKQLQFRDYYFILLKHKWILLLSLICFLLPTWYFLSQISDSYDAFSQISMEEGQEQTLYLMAPNVTQKNIGYYTGIFESRAFREMVANSISPSILPGTLQEKLEVLNSTLSMSAGSFKSFLKIKSRTESPTLSFHLVHFATDSLITYCKQVENKESEQAIAAIKEHLKATSQAYNDAQEEKAKFSVESVQGDIRGLSSLESEYEKQLVLFELENAEFEAKKTYFAVLDEKVQKKQSRPDTLRSKLLVALTQLTEEKRKRMEMGIPVSQDDTLNIRLQEVRSEIQALSHLGVDQAGQLQSISKWRESKKELLSAESELQFKKNKIQAFRKAIEVYREEHPDIVKQEFKINRLNELLARYEATHKRLTEKLEDEIIKNRAKTGGLTLVDPPFIPHNPIKRNDYIFFILAAIGGLALGIALAFIKAFMDDSIKSSEDFEKHFSLPVLGTIPHMMTRKGDLTVKRKVASGKDANLISRYPELILKATGEEGIIAESYRSLRTNLLFLDPDNPIHSVLFTSCGPHEGKSLTAANVALAFAQQDDPTVLVDADLRRPVCHHLFAHKRSPGIGEFISDDAGLEDIIQRSEGCELDLITAGHFLPNPAEVLGSKKFLGLVTELKKRYKYIIFDTPPILAVTDACLLSTMVDGVVIITRAEHTGIGMIKRTVQSLNQINANVYGCVINDLNLSKHSGYYGYYKNYSQYYHTVKD